MRTADGGSPNVIRPGTSISRCSASWACTCSSACSYLLLFFRIVNAGPRRTRAARRRRRRAPRPREDVVMQHDLVRRPGADARPSTPSSTASTSASARCTCSLARTDARARSGHRTRSARSGTATRSGCSRRAARCSSRSPPLYAAASAASISALMIVLWLLCGAASAIEFRHQIDHPLWRARVGRRLLASSVLLALLFGVALGNVVRGVPFERRRLLLAAALPHPELVRAARRRLRTRSCSSPTGRASSRGEPRVTSPRGPPAWRGGCGGPS